MLCYDIHLTVCTTTDPGISAIHTVVPGNLNPGLHKLVSEHNDFRSKPLVRMDVSLRT